MRLHLPLKKPLIRLKPLPAKQRKPLNLKKLPNLKRKPKRLPLKPNLQNPAVGKKEDWAPRIKQGQDTLHKHAIEGFQAMPAKGGNGSLSDDEVKAAVDYMANESGAKF